MRDPLPGRIFLLIFRPHNQKTIKVMKLSKDQIELVREINGEIEMSGSMLLFEEQFVQLFPKYKKDFEKMCRLHEKFEELLCDWDFENQDDDGEDD